MQSLKDLALTVSMKKTMLKFENMSIISLAHMQKKIQE